MEYFSKQMANIAVPIGTCALDENTVNTKARTRAKSYIANKPQPYGIRFYAVVGSKFTYLHSMVDNGSGNLTGFSRVQSYTAVFRNLRTVYENHFNASSCTVDIHSSTALWILQIAHQVKVDAENCNKRVVFTDHYYTRHIMANELRKITDNKAFLIGTAKYTNVDTISRINLNEAIHTMKSAVRRERMLVQAYDKIQSIEAERKKHNLKMKKLPIVQRAPFTLPAESIAERAGYIV